MLAVLLIMGLLANAVMATLSFDKNQQDVEDEAFRLQTFINYASEQAVMNQWEFGLQIAPDNYQLLIFDGERWQPVTPNPQLQPHELSESLELTLRLDDLEFGHDSMLNNLDWLSQVDSEQQNFLEQEKVYLPQILILSSGEVTPFEIEVQDQQHEQPMWLVRGEDLAPVSLVEPQS